MDRWVFQLSLGDSNHCSSWASLPHSWADVRPQSLKGSGGRVPASSSTLTVASGTGHRPHPRDGLAIIPVTGSLSSHHLVSQDAVEVVVVQRNHPRQTDHLVLSERRALECERAS